MRDLSAAKAGRIAAAVMVLLILAVFLFSAFYIASETCHDCVGEHCPVCSVIRQYESALRGLGGVMLARVSGAVQILFVLFAAAMIAAVLQQGTPVSRKVRLNN